MKETLKVIELIELNTGPKTKRARHHAVGLLFTAMVSREDKSSEWEIYYFIN